MKICIIGYSGSGKSTLAKHLSTYYRIPALYLDTVHFLPEWVERNDEEARAMVADFMQQNKSWVIDGNYGKLLQKERLEEADQIIFMNFSRFHCIRRAYHRYRTHKNKTRESMAKGCPEKFDFAFFKWLLYEGRTKKRRDHYRSILDQYPNKTVVIRNQRQLDAFIKGKE